MVYSVNQNWVNEYESNFRILSQQMFSVTENLVTRGDISAEFKFFPRVGNISMSEKTTPNVVNTYSDVAHTIRSVDFKQYDVTLSVDKKLDVSRMLTDPTSVYVQLGVAAWKRKIDEVIIAAALGTAYDGKTRGTSTTFPTATQTIDVNFLAGDPVGAGNGTGTWTTKAQSGFTLAKILKGKALIHSNFALSMGDRVSCIIGPDEEIDLYGISEFKSGDFSRLYPFDRPMVGDAYIGSWLGIDFYRSTLLTNTDPAGASNHYRSCLMFPTSGLGAYVGNELEIKIGENPERGFVPTIYINGGIGATRIEEVKMVEIRTSSGIADAA